MDADRLAVLRQQLDVTWSLAEYTLADLRADVGMGAGRRPAAEPALSMD